MRGLDKRHVSTRGSGVMRSDHIRHWLAKSMAVATVEPVSTRRGEGDAVTRQCVFYRSRPRIVQADDANLASLQLGLDESVPEPTQSITALHQYEIGPAIFRKPKDPAQSTPWLVDAGGLYRNHFKDSATLLLSYVDQAVFLPIQIPVPLLLDGGHASVDHRPPAAASLSG